MTRYDVIVIGSGAGGGTLAHRLAPSGKHVLLLERGGWLPREPANWRATDVFVDGRYISADTWHYSDGSPFQPQVHYRRPSTARARRASTGARTRSRSRSPPGRVSGPQPAAAPSRP